MIRPSEIISLICFLVITWMFYAIRTPDGDGEFAENSVRCVKLGGDWQKPRWLTPGWCKRVPGSGPKLNADGR